MLRSGVFKTVTSLLFTALLLQGCKNGSDKNIGQTEVSKWYGNKQAAVSLTYDDGIITQFTVARPLMNEFNFPATFFVLTGKIQGSEAGTFIGRPTSEIIRETASVGTNTDNFFERASLIGYTGTTEAMLYHSNAGSLYEQGKLKEAFGMIDEGYEKLRAGQLRNTDEVVYHDNPQDTTSWADLRAYAAEGHEIASHTITHPRLAVLDSVNLVYELEQSRLDIERHLGKAYTFSAECPYGTENERVMRFAHRVYPALRNRMPADYLEELNRSSKLDPGSSQKEYVQWQRGPLTDTSVDTMKSWINTCLDQDNIWLVLVFHGVNDFGWEPKTNEELKAFFTYVKDHEDRLWVGTFAEVTKYIRQRKHLELSSNFDGDAIVLNLKSDLDPEIYNVPLTFKTSVPADWKKVVVKQGQEQLQSNLEIIRDPSGSYIVYDLPSAPGEYIISGS